MTEYLMTITGIVLLSTVLTNVLPLGKTSQIIKNVVRLCLYLAILSPIYQFFEKEVFDKNGEIFQNYFDETVIQTDRSYIQYCSEISVENVEKQIEEELLKEYGIQSVVSIKLENDGSDNKIEKIYIQTDFLEETTMKSVETAYESKFLVDIEWIQGDD